MGAQRISFSKPRAAKITDTPRKQSLGGDCFFMFKNILQYIKSRKLVPKHLFFPNNFSFSINIIIFARKLLTSH